MNRFILSLISIAVLAGCTPERKKVVEYFTDGKISKIYYLGEGNQNGDTMQATNFWPNGNKRMEGEFKNNLREGEWTYWYKNGNVWSHGRFKNGLSEGKFDVYNEDGSRYLQSEYREGKPEGCWTFFEKNKEKKRVYFKHGDILKQLDIP